MRILWHFHYYGVFFLETSTTIYQVFILLGFILASSMYAAISTTVTEADKRTCPRRQGDRSAQTAVLPLLIASVCSVLRVDRLFIVAGTCGPFLF